MMRSAIAVFVLTAATAPVSAEEQELAECGAWMPYAITATPLEVTESPFSCLGGPMYTLTDGCVTVLQRRDCGARDLILDGVTTPAEVVALADSAYDQLTVCDLAPGPHHISACGAPGAPAIDCAFDDAADMGVEIGAFRPPTYQLRVRIEQVLAGPADAGEQVVTVPYDCEGCPPIDPATRGLVSLQWREDAPIPEATFCAVRPPLDIGRVEPPPRGCGCATSNGGPQTAALALLVLAATRRARGRRARPSGTAARCPSRRPSGSR